MPSVLAALLTLTACGGAGSSTPPAPQGTFPATVTHQYGKTVVEKAPERVVALGYTDQDALLALGTVPVAVRAFAGSSPSATWKWEADRLEGRQPTVLPTGDVAPEAVAALKPDLIVAITAGLTREQYDAFSKIAPTVAAPDGAGGIVTWQDQTKLTGAALGLPGEGDRVVKQVEDQFLEAEETRPELAGATVAAVRANPGDAGSFLAWSSSDLRGQFLKDLGLQLPTEVDRLARGKSSATLPAAELRTLDRSDALMVVGTEADRTAFTALPGYAQMKLVQSSKVVTLDDDQSAALTFGSVLSLPWVLDELTSRIARAVER
jgi:iron complex transport system substrate-binding protein